MVPLDDSRPEDGRLVGVTTRRARLCSDFVERRMQFTSAPGERPA